MRAAGAPSHLLLFDHTFADDLVDRGFDERGGDGLPDESAFPVAGDGAGVGGEVAAELADRLGELARLDADVGDVGGEVGGAVVDGLPGTKDVAACLTASPRADSDPTIVDDMSSTPNPFRFKRSRGPAPGKGQYLVVSMTRPPVTGSGVGWQGVRGRTAPVGRRAGLPVRWWPEPVGACPATLGPRCW